MSLDLKSLVRTIPDYPKKGILFWDKTPKEIRWIFLSQENFLM